MTVSYTGDVANASPFGCFNKILFKWKGSVYKLIYKVSKQEVTSGQLFLLYQGAAGLPVPLHGGQHHLQGGAGEEQSLSRCRDGIKLQRGW